MKRIKVTEKMVKFLGKVANCKNIINFLNKYYANKSESSGDKKNRNKLIIRNIPVAFYLIRYNDDESYKMGKNDDIKDTKWKKNVYTIFDFITESNYTGFEYFPYLYGVLDCHSGKDSRIYVFYEYFDQKLIEIINSLEHPSEWYDIAFQLISICYYMHIINSYKYDEGLESYLCKKMDKPYHKKYDLNGNIVTVSHNFVIVLYCYYPMRKLTEEDEIMGTIDLLLTYTQNNKDNMKVPPSKRIIKLLYDVKNDPLKTVDILYQYFGPFQDQ